MNCQAAHLVVLAGPNGSGKSSLFEAFKTWHSQSFVGGYDNDKYYYPKVGELPVEWPESVRIEFFEPIPEDGTADRTSF